MMPESLRIRDDVREEKPKEYYEMAKYDRAEQFVDRILEGRRRSYHSMYMLGNYDTLHNLTPQQVIMSEALNRINERTRFNDNVTVYMKYFKDGKSECYLCSADENDRDLAFEGKGRLVNRADASSDLYVTTIDGIEKPSDLIKVFEKGSKEKAEEQCYTVTDVRKNFADAQDTVNRCAYTLNLSELNYMFENIKKAEKIRETMETEFVIPKKYGKNLDIYRSPTHGIASGVLLLKSEGVTLPGLIGSRSDDENIYLSFARHSKFGFGEQIQQMNMSTGVVIDMFKKKMEKIDEQKKEINKSLPKISIENSRDKSNQRSASL